MRRWWLQWRLRANRRKLAVAEEVMALDRKTWSRMENRSWMTTAEKTVGDLRMKVGTIEIKLRHLEGPPRAQVAK